MSGPYPDAETAAHMLAEDIAYSEAKQGSAPQNDRELSTYIAGLRHAAWLLNIEELVEAKLKGES